MKKIICILYIAILIQSCTLPRFIDDKIQDIPQTESIKSTDSLTVLKPFIFSYTGVPRNDWNSHLLKQRIDSFSTYFTRDTVVEHMHEIGCYRAFPLYFFHKVQYFTPKILDSDYNILSVELKKVEHALHDSSSNYNQMSDIMYNILSKYKTRFFLLSHITENDSVERIAMSNTAYTHDVIICKLFIYDKSIKKLIYYNYGAGTYKYYPDILCSAWDILIHDCRFEYCPNNLPTS